jgi:hypothetical protein
MLICRRRVGANETLFFLAGHFVFFGSCGCVRGNVKPHKVFSRVGDTAAFGLSPRTHLDKSSTELEEKYKVRLLVPSYTRLALAFNPTVVASGPAIREAITVGRAFEGPLCLLAYEASDPLDLGVGQRLVDRHLHRRHRLGRAGR